MARERNDRRGPETDGEERDSRGPRGPRPQGKPQQPRSGQGQPQRPGQGQGQRPQQPGGGPRPQGAQPPRPQGDREQRPARTEPEIVCATPAGTVAADVVRGPLPLRWYRGQESMLIRGGLYAHHGGKLQQVARDLNVGDATLIAVWEDPHAEFSVGQGRSAKPGLHAAFLIKNASDGPPYFALTAQLRADGTEMDRGLLSPWLDQTGCVPFRAKLSIDKDALFVASEGAIGDDVNDAPLAETLAWLAANPDDNGAAATVTRRVLVDGGHGLQRFGLTLAHASRGQRERAVRDLLPALAPTWAPLLSALFDLFAPGLDSEARRRAFATVCEAMQPLLKPEHEAHMPSRISLLGPWVTGLFGTRPERDGAQPARALFAAARTLRSIGRRPELLNHVDVRLPVFPLDAGSNEQLVRELGRLPDDETDLERLVRALAIAEAGSDIARPRLDHLRPFRIAWPRVRAYPVAARTLSGRWDFVLSAWSFRGAELAGQRVDERAFEANLIIDSPSVTTTRALARVLAARGVRDTLAAALAKAPHPTIVLLSELAKLDGDALVARYADATSPKKTTSARLFAAVAAGEMLVARAEAGDGAPGWLPLAPELPDDSGGARTHFMFWRQYCRSIAWHASASYGDFLESMVPRLAELMPKLQNEVFALMRQWLRHDAANRTRAGAWLAPLRAIVAPIANAAEESRVYRGERLHSLLQCIAELDPTAFIAELETLAAHKSMADLELHRVFDVPRRQGFRDAWVASPGFAALHARLEVDSDAAAIAGRAEWTRTLLEAPRNSAAMRRVLDVRTHFAFVSGPAFTEWFVQRGFAAIRDPARGLLELVEVAVRDTATLDDSTVVGIVRGATRWSDDELIKLFAEAGRHRAALDIMRTHNAGDSTLVERSIDALVAHARGGSDFLAAADAIAASTLRFGAPPLAAQASLVARYARYSPDRFALDGFIDALDAWRIAALDPFCPTAVQLAEKAILWSFDTNRRATVLFGAWMIEQHAAKAATEVITRIIAGDSGALEAASQLAAPPVVEALSSMLTAKRTGSQRGRQVRKSLLSLRTAGAFDAAFTRAVVDAWIEAGASDAAAHEIAARLAGAIATTKHAEPEAETAEAVEPAEPTETADVTPSENADATEVVEAPIESTPASRAAASQAFGEAVSRRLVTLVQSWNGLLEAIAQDEAGVPPVLVRRLTDFRPSFYPTRERLFGAIEAIARAQGFKIDDTRRVANAEWMVGLGAEVDLGDFAVLVSFIASLATVHSLEPTLALGRSEVALPIIARRDANATTAAAPAPEAPAAEEAPAEGEAPAEDAGADDDEGTEAAEPKTSPRSILRAGFASDASAEALKAAFGSTATLRLVRELLRRNPSLRLTVDRVNRKQAVILAWR